MYMEAEIQQFLSEVEAEVKSNERNVMMGIKYYLKAAVSEYTDKDGQPKKRYQTIGIVTETKKAI